MSKAAAELCDTRRGASERIGRAVAGHDPTDREQQDPTGSLVTRSPAE
jgi:hypothetical protein